MEKEVVLGIDIGGSYTKVGLVTQKGDIIDKTAFKTDAQKPFSDFIKRLKAEVDTLVTALEPGVSILFIGVGAPNANPYTGEIENPPNLNWGAATPLAKTINQSFKLPVTIANDANAAALGEMFFGAGKGMKNFVALTLGTGLGSGIIVDGKLLIGAHGAAGELGHVNVDPHGRSCNCGLRGCLETYASVTGIKRTVFELMADMTEPSPLRNYSFETMTGTAISEAALNGDPIALAAFDKTGEILGSKMADTAAHLDPEAFILSGGLSKAGDILLNPIKTRMEHHLFGAYKGKVKVLLSTATGDNAVLGPAALAWTELENTRVA
ncbi:ROK family protein [Pseudozobellia thermophila]|uniref:Glucokinase n=1 Tax=Pseudozobellia thermophila TaxID=192903 RepID=A0A1M6IMC2_9FLAO|nr:ROK family protein [Pseudozobellia thermophila]SHJ35523.1 glucokinase [Pseudozobellia thermophila]